MKSVAAASLLLLCLSTPARAEPFTVTATLATSAVFSCNSRIPCTGQGTNSISIGSGANVATLTFRGVNTSFEASPAEKRVVPIGEFELDAPDGFLVPGTNPNRWVVKFALNFQQTLPVAASGTHTLLFGVSEQPYFQWLSGSTFFSTPVGPNPPFNYQEIVYTLQPYPIRINLNETERFSAQAGIVPEPGTIVLLSTGLAGAALARRRRRRTSGSDESANSNNN
jgi:hypothetical protein